MIGISKPTGKVRKNKCSPLKSNHKCCILSLSMCMLAKQLEKKNTTYSLVTILDTFFTFEHLHNKWKQNTKSNFLLRRYASDMNMYNNKKKSKSMFLDLNTCIMCIIGFLYTNVGLKPYLFAQPNPINVIISWIISWTISWQIIPYKTERWL